MGTSHLCPLLEEHVLWRYSLFTCAALGDIRDWKRKHKETSEGSWCVAIVTQSSLTQNKNTKNTKFS